MDAVTLVQMQEDVEGLVGFDNDGASGCVESITVLVKGREEMGRE